MALESAGAAHAAFAVQRRFGSLDGLRAVSILAVIWHHTAPSWVGAVLSRVGVHGVTLFFAISGFLITTLLLRERDQTGAIDLKAFYLRRSLRIFPLYYGVLLLYVLLVWALQRHTPEGQAFFGNLIYFITYTSNLFVPLEGRVIFYFAWSLAAEEQFYLIWPSVLIGTRSRERAMALLAVLSGAVVIGQWLQWRCCLGFPLAIVLGAWLALLLHRANGYARLWRGLGQPWAAPLALALLVCVAALTVANEWPSWAVHACAVLLVACCVIREDHALAPALQWAPLAYAGTISYGLYMLHMMCKNVAVKIGQLAGLPADGLWLVVATVVLSVGVATLSWRYGEARFLALKHRFERSATGR